MATLYLTEQGAVLRKSSDHFIIEKSKVKLQELPCADVDHLMIYGNIQVTTPALWELAEHGIEIAFFTQGGKLLLQLTPQWPKNLPLREAQWRRRFEPEFVLRFSRAIVAGKLNNALAVIRDYQHNHPELDCATELAAIEAARTKAENAAGLDSLLGLEGSATAAYFKVLGRMFLPPWQFATRSRRPPKDPVNAVLSFGYVIVGNELQSHLDGIGFDPYAGFYHASEYGRPSLALDLLEEFRHSLVDRLALHLFNQNVFTTADFQNLSVGGVHLNRDGQKKFFQSYERYLGSFRDQPSPSAVGYFRQHFKNQAQKLAKAIQENGDYAPFQLSG
ncbi:MAG: CRISPR-associated endonuclease Cas1 [candidate division KSB1 bacterium]|nr:CRISPR-associated endonuclease Cas1 [candidate division KSB1 bacterium]MDZ7365954.1 CRISPR-associated endonuclease Cas1 [candidate division KSB1 bacterium]MDZ7403813.1 CRISPR-associated endonuclease Cas1 [candidate division KSB1 bacterium]